MRNLLLALFLLSLFSFSQAHAESKPQELNPVIKAHHPYGKAALKRLIFYAYDAQLWTDAAHWSYQSPFALSLIYHMSFSSKELVDKSVEEMDGLHKISKKQKQIYISYLQKAFRNVKDGDHITAIYTPKTSIAFYYNGALTASIASPTFARAFLDIWLSEKTSEPHLRKKLLGEDN